MHFSCNFPMTVAGVTIAEISNHKFDTEFTFRNIEQAILKAFPDEVRHIWSRVGSAEIATDPMGVEETDIFISLYPRSRWTKAATQAELTEQIEKEIQTIRGARFAFSQPIKQRIDEMTSGARADLAVKLFGDDIKTLQTKAAEIEKVLKSIDGAADVNVEPLTGLAILQVKVKPDVLARHGLSAQIVLDVVEALAGTRLSEVVEGDYRFPLVVRLPEDYRGLGKSAQDARDLLKEMPIITAKGERLPLSTLATVEVLENSPSIKLVKSPYDDGEVLLAQRQRLSRAAFSCSYLARLRGLGCRSRLMPWFMSACAASSVCSTASCP